MSSAYFDSAVGGDGSTVTDDSDPTTGLDAGGHRTRFVPALAQVVAVAANTVTKAQEAAASAASALSAPGTNANSTTSVAIGTGSKSFTIETGKLYSIGQTLIAASKANPANSMTGIVTAHNNSTGALTLSVSQVSGSGTFADWTVSMGAVVSSSLPSQTGNANKFLQTDGSSASWQSALRPSQNLADVTTPATAWTNLGGGTIGKLNSINNSHWSGTALAVANGGTGSTTAAEARSALSAAASGANSDITSLSGLTTALSIAQGGTGATTAATARTALGLGSIATQSASSVAITGGSITGITDLAVADGGTGASTAAGARANLAAAVSGTNNDITSLTALTTVAMKAIVEGGLDIGTGYVRLASNLKIAWGTNAVTPDTSGTAGEASITFGGGGFTTSVYSVQATPILPSGGISGSSYTPYVRSVTTSGCQLGLDSTGTPHTVTGVFWFAIGD